MTSSFLNNYFYKLYCEENPFNLKKPSPHFCITIDKLKIILTHSGKLHEDGFFKTKINNQSVLVKTDIFRPSQEPAFLAINDIDYSQQIVLKKDYSIFIQKKVIHETMTKYYENFIN